MKPARRQGQMRARPDGGRPERAVRLTGGARARAAGVGPRAERPRGAWGAPARFRLSSGGRGVQARSRSTGGSPVEGGEVGGGEQAEQGPAPGGAPRRAPPRGRARPPRRGGMGRTVPETAMDDPGLMGQGRREAVADPPGDVEELVRARSRPGAPAGGRTRRGRRRRPGCAACARRCAAPAGADRQERHSGRLRPLAPLVRVQVPREHGGHVGRADDPEERVAGLERPVDDHSRARGPERASARRRRRRPRPPAAPAPPPGPGRSAARSARRRRATRTPRPGPGGRSRRRCRARPRCRSWGRCASTSRSGRKIGSSSSWGAPPGRRCRRP